MGQVVDCFLHPPLGASQLLQGLLVVQVVDWHQHLLLEALHLVQVVDFFLQPPLGASQVLEGLHLVQLVDSFLQPPL